MAFIFKAHLSSKGFGKTWGIEAFGFLSKSIIRVDAELKDS